ncbi:hypothetical protein PVAND_001253 [Polypedilum vanderplanki]|uniref:Uncharacterized protein n=1 Tax=Polypedilum vanderplanki TaxID=319348 RepID=A0A9J6BNP1_POLVA|nr:hypothetical protein PVAND_001253 [Polypedilum vanderplanki]
MLLQDGMLMINRERTCLQLGNEEYVRQYQAVQWNEEFVQNGQRQRFWLNCVQLGQFSVANNGQDHPFGTRFDMNFMRRWCANAFGNDIFLDQWWMEDTINSVNRNFGGLNPAIYRIFLTYGEMDPIRSLGPSNDINQNSPVVVMPMQSHARDLGSPDDTDYVVLQETKRRVQEAVFYWIEYARYGELPAVPYVLSY